MKHTMFCSFVVLAVAAALLWGCSKNDNNPVAPTGPVYPVTVTVHNPAGEAQGGATVFLKGKPENDPVFSAITDTSGKATIKAPAGVQTLVAKIGSVFQAEFNVNVAASDSGTNAGVVTLQQNTSLKVLVVKADAEQLENVLRDPKIGFTAFDSVSIYDMRDSATSDSTRLLNFFRQYTLIFSDCNGGDEGGYPLLSRIYGRYVQGGGKIYGGHYNYYNLQVIWQGYYDSTDIQGSPSTDTIQIVDVNLQHYLGFAAARWNSTDYRALSGYEKFSNIPPASTVYGVIKNTSPSVPVIVENHAGTGKYLWTDYHNQDIKDDPTLIKIVQYFLYSL